jgi:hypothetical protein
MTGIFRKVYHSYLTDSTIMSDITVVTKSRPPFTRGLLTERYSHYAQYIEVSQNHV